MTEFNDPRAPCHVDARDECFIVVDAADRPVAYVYFAENARRSATGRWSREEARAIAKRIARGFTLSGARSGSENAPPKA